MRLLIDAQLPRRLASWLAEQGYDAMHTLDLPLANATPDSEVIACAIREQRIVVTKDSDFVESFIVKGMPPKLWLISTGNISNQELETLIRDHHSAIARVFESARFIELSRDALTVHE